MFSILCQQSVIDHSKQDINHHLSFLKHQIDYHVGKLYGIYLSIQRLKSNIKNLFHQHITKDMLSSCFACMCEYFDKDKKLPCNASLFTKNYYWERHKKHFQLKCQFIMWCSGNKLLLGRVLFYHVKNKELSRNLFISMNRISDLQLPHGLKNNSFKLGYNSDQKMLTYY